MVSKWNIFHLMVHPPKGCDSQGWARLQGPGTSVQVAHCARGPGTWDITCCFPRHNGWELDGKLHGSWDSSLCSDTGSQHWREKNHHQNNDWHTLINYNHVFLSISYFPLAYSQGVGSKLQGVSGQAKFYENFSLYLSENNSQQISKSSLFQNVINYDIKESWINIH